MISRHEIVQKAKNKNPTTRMVQPNPISLIKRDSMMGKTMPPADDPELTMPNTSPRLFLNHEVVEVRQVEKIAPDPRELTIDCESSIW